MKTAILLGVLMTSAVVGVTDVRAQYVGSSHIQWSWDTTTVNLNNPWAVNTALTSGYASPYVQYFTPFWYAENAPNIYNGNADQGFVQVYSIMHDWNTHNSPFGAFWGYVDIVTPLFGITHKQIADFFSLGVSQVPSNLPFPSHLTDSFRYSYDATGWGSYPAAFNSNGDGYREAAKLHVPLPKAYVTTCGQLRVNEALRANTAIYSCNYVYALALTVNGQLIFSNRWTGQVYWYTPVAGISDYALVVQPDGDVVQYRPNWMRVVASGTRGHPGAFVHLTDDGHLDIRKGGAIIARIH